MEGARIVLPTGSLTHRFFGVRKVRLVSAGSGTPFLDGKKLFFGEKVQKVDMEFYREKRVPKSHCFELTLVASRTRMYPNGYNMLNRPLLRAPAVHGVSSIARSAFTFGSAKSEMFFVRSFVLLRLKNN